MFENKFVACSYDGEIVTFTIVSEVFNFRIQILSVNRSLVGIYRYLSHISIASIDQNTDMVLFVSES